MKEDEILRYGANSTLSTNFVAPEFGRTMFHRSVVIHPSLEVKVLIPAMNICVVTATVSQLRRVTWLDGDMWKDALQPSSNLIRVVI